MDVPDGFDFADLLEPKLRENLDTFLKEQVGNEEPFGILLDGTAGLSKTTSAGIIARYIQPNFSEENQIGQGVDLFIKAYNYTIDKVRAKVKVCVYDEANESDRGNSLSRIQKILNSLLTATTRQEKVVILVVLHRFYRLDEKFVDNSLIHMLIHLYQKRNGKYVKFNAYDIDSMLWMIHLLSKGKVVKKPKVYSRSLPNFGGRIIAPPDWYIEAIKKISKSGKDLLRKRANRDLLANSYYTVTVLASMLQVTKSQVSYQIKENDLQKTFLREKSGRIFYYDKELFAVLKQIFQSLENRKSLLSES